MEYTPKTDAAQDCERAESDPPRNDDAERERAAWLEWRLGLGHGSMTEAEKSYYGRKPAGG